MAREVHQRRDERRLWATFRVTHEPTRVDNPGDLRSFRRLE